jgi:hypothetical protein
MSRNAEQDIQRRNTLAFISARPSRLVLVPSVRQRTATGGSILVDGPARSAQTFRVVEQGSAPNNTPGQLRAADGAQERTDFLLLGSSDAIVEVGDHWSDTSGAKYRVTEMVTDNGYEKRAKVVKYG